MNKNIIYILIICAGIMFSSCWIDPENKNYEVVEGVYFFEDYETMKSVLIPMINSSFTSWHWNNKEFDQKYQKYLGNIEPNHDDYESLIQKGSSYAVRNPKSLKAVINNSSKTQDIKECYWITTNQNESVIFYQN